MGRAIPKNGEFGTLKVEEAISTIELCQSVEELKRSLQTICENYGFSSFNFLETGAPQLDIPYFLGTMKEEFSKDYFDNKLIHVDPCISFARRINTPFTWSEVPFPQYNGVRKSGAQRTMEVACDHGYKEGLIVPFHFSDRVGRIHSSLIVFFWDDKPRDFYLSLEKRKHELHLIMIYWAQRMVDFVGEQFQESHLFAAVQPEWRECRLSDRERDVLSWAARGKTATDTAAILTLSEETVKTHIRNALAKLDASNKTHGVAKAIYMGLIDV